MLYRLKHQDAGSGSCTSPGNKVGPYTDEKVLWARFTAGDEDAFASIYDAYFEELCHFGAQYISLPLAEDCIQDMFIDLRSKREKLPEIRNSIRLFLFQCLKRKILNLKKSAVREVKCPEPFEIVVSHESLIIFHQEQKERMEKLERALRSLNETQREAVYYYFYKGMSYEDVCQLMGYRHVKSARNLIYKVIKVLRKYF
ncbi:sigma-70 family RNA polymerase sigma factor [Sinomicrobium pectinilyticum]|uniref:Sigma-70 family RNA polymerase sigma factor n=1 Tax=Sinomicrobium pectinilyticum TaxID=1084421 RepID=A0A3N0E457_SINP1|nr:sigma-70 family RNA polymerase sigma factor [Sinomicrobium pectinilyticum]RNL82608.1 sigma-70 family RNA polymerase sigma factor [Sinomicrobium pectinilyticum]